MNEYYIPVFIAGLIVGMSLMVYKVNKTDKAYWTWRNAYEHLECKLKHYEEVFKLMGKEIE